MDISQPAVTGGDPLRPSLRAWGTLAILCLVSAFNYMDRMLLAVVSQPIRLEFGLSDTQLGLLTGIAFATLYSILAIPMGRLADRVSRKKLLAACLACWSLATALTGFAVSYLHLLITRMLVAIGESGCTPSSYTLLADNFDARRRNLALGIFTGASMLGVAGGFALGGWISQVYGWRAAFYWLGGPGLLLAVAMLFLMAEPVRGATDERPADPAPPTKTAILLLMRNRAFVLLILGAGLNGLGVYATSQWMPQFFIRTHHLTLTQVGVMFGMAFGLGMFAGNVIGGAIAARLGRRSIGAPMWLSVVCSLLIVPLYAGALLTPSVVTAVILTTLAAVIGAAANPPSTAACQNFVPANVRATAGAFILLAVSIMGIGCGPLVVGAASDLLRPSFGEDGLRYALVGLQVINVMAAVFYGLAGRSADRTLGPVAKGTP